jgi:hypothetical protein
MSRFAKDYKSKKSTAELQKTVDNFMAKEGFSPYSYKGETVWKKGAGLMVAPQFMKFTVADGSVHLEAWVKYALLPGVYVGEMGINGVMLVIPKNLLRTKIIAFEKLIAT